MQQIDYILTTAGSLATILIIIIPTLISLIKSKKGKIIAQNILKICNEILPYIQKAEEFVNYTGLEKKTYVETLARKFAIDNKIPYDDELVSSKIEELVELTKKVNKRIKDTVIEAQI